LLASLPDAAYEKLQGHLDVVAMPYRDVLQQPGEVAQHVFFPGGGFISIVVVYPNGLEVEVGTVGREGMANLAAVVPGRQFASNVQLIVQGPAEECYRLPADRFREAMLECGPFTDIVNRFDCAQLAMVMQVASCNASHRLEQRLAKWLLIAADRMQSDEFDITQEFLAMMLGATRPAVTLIAGTFQKSGWISYKRGRMRILDRPALERTTCECYRQHVALINGVLAQETAARP
jgi:CRP-like cAMP-binding protein